MNHYPYVRFIDPTPSTWWQRHGNKFKVAGFCFLLGVAFGVVWATIATVCRFPDSASSVGGLLGIPVGMVGFCWAENRWPIF